MYANGTAGARYVSADGKWLSIPDAALIGTAKTSDAEKDAAILLTLSNPVYNAATQVCASPAYEYLPHSAMSLRHLLHASAD